MEGKVCVVVGAGQSPGERADRMGNGRATAVLFAREGAAAVVCLDKSLEAAEETAALIRGEGFGATAAACDITRESDIEAAVAEILAAHGGRIDVLHNNVGVSLAGGDAMLEELTEEAFDTVFNMCARLPPAPFSCCSLTVAPHHHHLPPPPPLGALLLRC